MFPRLEHFLSGNYLAVTPAKNRRKTQTRQCRRNTWSKHSAIILKTSNNNSTVPLRTLQLSQRFSISKFSFLFAVCSLQSGLFANSVLHSLNCQRVCRDLVRGPDLTLVWRAKCSPSLWSSLYVSNVSTLQKELFIQSELWGAKVPIPWLILISHNSYLYEAHSYASLNSPSMKRVKMSNVSAHLYS